jgi:outer membrane receptor protein involved in Fe transport
MRMRVLTMCCLASLFGAGTAGTATASPFQQSVSESAIPAMPLNKALNAFAQREHLQLVYISTIVDGVRTQGVPAGLSAEKTLQKLLEGTGLKYRFLNAKTVTIYASTGPQSTGGPSKGKPTANARGVQAEPTTLDTVSVTGTRIRGGNSPSPVITFGSEQMRQEGFTDLGEAIRNMPQNFSGGQNPGVAAGAGQGGQQSNQNLTGGSGLNLRGLGPDATLTLLNGRRMSYGGLFQAVDVSAIPMEAVDRIEIVPDGASAIYGSDAVGGVANVILKRDFNGVTAGTRYGGAMDGGLITHEYSITAGTTWTTGGLIVAGEKASNDPIYSDQRDYARSMYRSSTLWQANDLRSGLFSLHQSLGDSVELHLDALRSDRSISTDAGYSGLYYHSTPETKTTLVSPSLDWQLPNDWLLTLSVAYGRDKTLTHQQAISTATGVVSSNSIGAYGNKSLNYEIDAEGPLFTLPGGESRLATGAGYRYNDFLYMSGSRTSADGDESSRFAYAELSLPLIGPEQGIGGIERFELTGAIRTEDGDYGRVTTPKLGVIYSPSADFSLKASWGKSFKAPTLAQRYLSKNAIYYPAEHFGAGYPVDATALYLSGGSTGLRPERARTWSSSLVFHPEALSGLEAELTWFDIDYTQRVLQPITGVVVLGNPIYAEFIDYDPTEAAQATALANANFYNSAGTPYDASKVRAIVDGRYVNAARQRVKGVDLSGSYQTDLGAGRLTVRGSASWLDSAQSLTAAQSPYDLAGTLFYPARINGRIGAVWQQSGFTASLFGNYKGGVTNTADGSKGASFTTFDATLRYDTGERHDAWSNLALELSAQNLLNRAPPMYAVIPLTVAHYDSTNYSAVGRFLSISISKHW